MLVGHEPGISLADGSDSGQSESVDGARTVPAPPVLLQMLTRTGRIMPLLVLSSHIRLQDSPQFLQFFLILKQFVEPGAKRLEYQEEK